MYVYDAPILNGGPKWVRILTQNKITAKALIFELSEKGLAKERATFNTWFLLNEGINFFWWQNNLDKTNQVIN